MSEVLKRRKTGSQGAQSSKARDYSRPKLNGRENATAVIKAVLTAAGAAFLCYDCPAVTLAAIPLIPVYIRYARKKKEKEIKWELNLAFGELIRAVSAALEGGYSFENAVIEAYKDMKQSHSEKEPVMEEIRLISARIANNVPVEEAFRSLGRRSGIEDISGFADVFATAKRTGGNSIEIIRSTAELIRTRVELTRDMRMAVASKHFEADIMKIVPICMAAYLRFFSPDLFCGLYGNVKGVIFMSALLVLYAAMCALSAKITDIKL